MSFGCNNILVGCNGIPEKFWDSDRVKIISIRSNRFPIDIC